MRAQFGSISNYFSVPHPFYDKEGWSTTDFLRLIFDYNFVPYDVKPNGKMAWHYGEIRKLYDYAVDFAEFDYLGRHFTVTALKSGVSKTTYKVTFTGKGKWYDDPYWNGECILKFDYHCADGWARRDRGEILDPFYTQALSEADMWNEYWNKPEGNALLPYFQYEKRIGSLWQVSAQDVNHKRTLLDRGYEDRYDIYDVAEKLGIGDLHGANICAWRNVIRVLDYGLYYKGILNGCHI